MLKGLLKTFVASAVGFLSIIGGYFVVGALDHGHGPISNERLVGELLLPIPCGLIVAVLVYRILDKL
jgi:hypothetical protein